MKNAIFAGLAYALLMGGGCLQTGCSQVSREHWIASAQHTTQALEHTGGALVEGVKALGAGVKWAIDSGAKLVPLIP